MIQINSVPYHGGLSEELYFSDNDRGDEPDHDQLGDDPLPLDVLLLALLLERVAVDVLPTQGLVVVTRVVTPSILVPPRPYSMLYLLISRKVISNVCCIEWTSYSHDSSDELANRHFLETSNDLSHFQGEFY